MIDASHSNSGKKPENQMKVIEDVSSQIEAGEDRIIGAMIESNLVAGRQELAPRSSLTYGQSITDGCAGFDESVAMLDRLARAVEARRRTGRGKQPREAALLG
jgi:3-deoxy-7-phosphoheptulonate synthase